VPEIAAFHCQLLNSEVVLSGMPELHRWAREGQLCSFFKNLKLKNVQECHVDSLKLAI
jgi:hypothetical protein